MPKKKNPERIIDNAKSARMLDRIAYQILEENYEAEEIIILGIANKGLLLAKLITKRLKKFGNIPIQLSWIKLNKINPNDHPIELGNQKLDFKDKTIIIIDDVGNTGRTLYYAMQPLANHLPKKVQAAVLVDRMHKLFPIKADFVGLHLATTFKEMVIVEFDENDKVEGAYLH